MKKKRILSILLIAMMCLAACSQSQNVKAEISNTSGYDIAFNIDANDETVDD